MMKRLFIWLSLSLVLFLLLAGCSSIPWGISNIDWVDFIKLSDITYLRAYQVGSINESDLSPYDKISYKVADNVRNPAYKIKNGDAAYLEAGTPVYSLNGYAPSFRLVARSNQEFLIYEADSNPKAKKGSDLLDIGGKVESISINSKIDGKTELATIKEQTQVNELEGMILEAPVDQDSSKTGSEHYFLEFHLNDGTTTKRSYWLDTELLSRGIQLPEEFGIAIQSALNEQRK
ncbi:MAG: hypothetical protein PHH57_05070 [Candidatus Omnitrophica bacterium]|nr:hypothetical protein [Candidatus Omnitrophota bacterium]